jgi:NAD(P)-dependent dehydrogenase (short-subunit alcohol dehydrogenase family)
VTAARTFQSWRDEVAVVTGGGSGIGRALCLALAAKGLHVAVADVEAATAEQTATDVRATGRRAIAVATDVRRRGEVERLAARTTAELGDPFVVCNNAGVFVGGPLLGMQESDWRWVLDVNLMGVAHGVAVFAPLLVARGAGHILNTASVGGFLSGGVTPVYSISKFGVVALGEALRAELGPHGVGVTTLCPGATATRLADSNRLRPADCAAGGGDSRVLAPLIDGGVDPSVVAAAALAGLERDAAYVFPDASYRPIFAERFARILDAFDDA